MLCVSKKTTTVFQQFFFYKYQAKQDNNNSILIQIQLCVQQICQYHHLFLRHSRPRQSEIALGVLPQLLQKFDAEGKQFAKLEDLHEKLDGAGVVEAALLRCDDPILALVVFSHARPKIAGNYHSINVVVAENFSQKVLK